ncbi:MAG: RnfABCDGE type electron transport complex subunit A [Actinobacteria bacterium]|nr:RnfABCDGE type electron transport complex subunit A [Actinomycetota bacterium]MCG2789410.1 RnfABCDGE type electron transport complex subunit A [Actinomycetes bacterium]
MNSNASLVTIFIGMVIINNMVLTKFLGLCPFFGVSKKLSNAISMGVAVTFVMLLAATATSVIYNYILVPYEIEFMNIIIYILVIASLVQIVEITIRRTNIALYNALGIYLPLITTNCAVLGIALINASNNYSIVQSMVSAVGGGLGFTLVLIIMSGIRERLELGETPKSLRGLPIAFVTAALLALAFMGFSGLL